jgi:pimeloyl-ACP methyl ester carboxylesterase
MWRENMNGGIQIEAGYADIFGAPLYYEIAGSGPALVLLHEGFADSRMYDDQVAAFAAHHRVIRYDRHGSGRSGVPTVPYTDHHALHDLLRHLGVERAILLGMSAGGGVALDAALAYPGMVEDLILVATAIGGYESRPETLQGWAKIGAALEQGDVPEAVERTLRMWVDGPERHPDQVDPGVRRRVGEMMAHYFTRTHGTPCLLEPPAIGRLAEIGVPTLVVAAAGDVPDIQAQAGLLTQRIAEARNVTMRDAAHVPNMEQPETFNRLVLDFLAMVR